jgi:hypothetical protein
MKQAFEKNVRQVNQACNLIGKYSECLLVLVDGSYSKDLKEESGELSLQLNAALQTFNQYAVKKIPVNIGDFIGLVVDKAGTMRLKHLQKKYLKGFVDSGALIINDVCDYFTEEMALSLNAEMSSLDTQFDNVMGNFYDNIEQYQLKQNINPFDYLKSYNPIYLSLKERLTQLHALQKTTISALKKIKSTHEMLRTSVDSRMPAELIAEVKGLYANMQDIRSAYKKLNETEE